MSKTEEHNVLGPGQVMRMAIIFGLFTGTAEAGLRLSQRARGARTFLSQDVVWMAPLADLLLFIVCGALLIAVAATFRREIRRATAVGLFLFLALLGPALAYPRLHWAASVILVAGAARVLTPLGARVATGRPARALAGAALIVVLVLTGRLALVRSGADAGLTEAAAQTSTPNVLLLVLDTVRSDDLSAYGYGLPTSPTLEEIAAQGVVFERAYATSPWTLTSHASLFTGEFPGDTSADWEAPLDEDALTLADWFAARGYATGGFVGNLIYGTWEMGMQQGFHRYEDYPVSFAMVLNSSLLARQAALTFMRLAGVDGALVRRSARDLSNRALDWIDGVDRPFFAFVNYMDAHAPYVPPSPFREAFGPAREGPALADLSERSDWTPEELEAERAMYDGSIAYVDSEIGRFLDGLAARGLLDGTIVIVTSDHGEQFGEKGLVDHGNSLYRTVLDVPLIIRFPEAVPADVRVSAPVSLRDLPRTITDLVSGSADFPGVSLAPSWRDEATAGRSPVFAEVTSGVRMPAWTPIARGDMASLIADGSHYIRNGDGVEELYDLEDRAHAVDLSSVDPERLARLRAMVDSIQSARTASR
jgi:arylsulfatase A-like enzyme